MSALSHLTLPSESQPSSDYNNELQIVDENGDPVNWQDDPNEPRYCLCNQVSYGEMVGCDNNDVSFMFTVFSIAPDNVLFFSTEK